MWRSSVDCSNDHKSTRHEKILCLENHHRRFGYAESLRKKLVNDNQWENLTQVYQDIIGRLQTELDLLHRVITGDDTCLFEYDHEIKRQSRQKKFPTSPRPKKARQSE